MRMTFGILLLLSGGVTGYLVGSYFSPGKPLRFVYETKADVVAFNRDQSPLGILPKGTLLLSGTEIKPTADFGWWGYAPVYLGDMDQAHQMVVKTSQRPGQLSIMQMIWGVPPDQARRPMKAADTTDPLQRPSQ